MNRAGSSSRRFRSRCTWSITDALKPFALRAHQQGVALTCEIGPEVPAGVIGDPTRIQQILINLVGNALKFTERGQVLVVVRQDSRTERSTKLHFSVTDTGIGIPPEKHHLIFEPFRQADESTTRRFGGTGLGLAISATLVRLMGGRIWVESVPGAGSTFQFTVPLDVTEAEAAVDPRAAIGRAIGGRPPAAAPSRRPRKPARWRWAPPGCGSASCWSRTTWSISRSRRGC